MYLHWRPKKWWYIGINLWKCMRQPGEVLSRSTSSREKSANWLAKGWAGVADVAEGRLFKEFVEPENLERLDFKWPTNEPWNWFLKKKLVKWLNLPAGICRFHEKNRATYHYGQFGLFLFKIHMHVNFTL